jgi:hypothetical protein
LYNVGDHITQFFLFPEKNKLECFVPCKTIQPNLKFVYEDSILRMSFHVLHLAGSGRYRTRPKMLSRDERSSLSVRSINEVKSFKRLTRGQKVQKINY